MGTERKIFGWRFWTASTLGLLALYVASFGPACWLDSRRAANKGHSTLSRPLSVLFRPLLFIGCNNRQIGAAVIGYAQFGAQETVHADIGWVSEGPDFKRYTADLMWSPR